MRGRNVLRRGLIAAFSLAVGAIALTDRFETGIISRAVADSHLSISVSSVTMTVGQTTTVGVSGSSGTVRLSNSDASVASATYSNRTVTIKGLKTGSTDIKVSDNNSSKTIKVSVIGGLTVSAAAISHLDGRQQLDGPGKRRFRLGVADQLGTRGGVGDLCQWCDHDQRPDHG